MNQKKPTAKVKYLYVGGAEIELRPLAASTDEEKEPPATELDDDPTEELDGVALDEPSNEGPGRRN